MKVMVGSGNAALDQALVEAFTQAGHEPAICAYAEALAEKAKAADAAVVGAGLPASSGTGLLGVLVALRLEGVRVAYLPGDREQADRETLTQAVAVGVYDIVFDPVDPGSLVGALAEAPSLRRGLSALRRPGERAVGTAKLGDALHKATESITADSAPEARKRPRPRAPAVPVAERVAGAAATVATVGATAAAVATARVRQHRAPPPEQGETPAWWAWPECTGGPGLDLAVLAALPRSGATRALAAWALGRGQALLVDANPDRQGLGRVLGGAQAMVGWASVMDASGATAAVQRLPGGFLYAEALWPRSGGAPSADDWVACLDRAVRLWRLSGLGPIAADMGSPPPPDRGELHPIVRYAGKASHVAVVAQSDPEGLFAGRAVIDAVRACGAVDVQAWIVGYRAEAGTVEELGVALGAPCAVVS